MITITKLVTIFGFANRGVLTLRGMRLRRAIFQKRIAQQNAAQPLAFANELIIDNTPGLENVKVLEARVPFTDEQVEEQFAERFMVGDIFKAATRQLKNSQVAFKLRTEEEQTGSQNTQS